MYSSRPLCGQCNLLVTSANNIKLHRAFVCLFVYLVATLRNNYRSDLHKIFTRDVSLDEKFFWNDSSTLQDWAFFHSLAHISGNLIGRLLKLYQGCIFGQGSSIKFWKPSGTSGFDSERIRLGGGLRSPSALGIIIAITVYHRHRHHHHHHHHHRPHYSRSQNAVYLSVMSVIRSIIICKVQHSLLVKFSSSRGGYLSLTLLFGVNP